MDFTILLLAVFLLLALQQQLWPIAGALLLLILFTAKSKILIVVALAGIGMAALTLFGNAYPSWLIIAGLFLILLYLARKDDRPTGPEAYYPGGY